MDINLKITPFILYAENAIENQGDYNNPYVRNTEEFMIFGIESHLDLKLFKWFSLFVNYTFLERDFSFLYGSDGRPFVIKSKDNPRHNLHFGIAFEIGKSNNWTKLNISFSGQYYYGLWGKDLYNWRMPDAIIFNLMISYTPKNYFTVYVKLNNLFNTYYELKWGYPMPGFLIFGGI